MSFSGLNLLALFRGFRCHRLLNTLLPPFVQVPVRATPSQAHAKPSADQKRPLNREPREIRELVDSG
jgi:hypothetical protein